LPVLEVPVGEGAREERSGVSDVGTRGIGEPEEGADDLSEREVLGKRMILGSGWAELELGRKGGFYGVAVG
jgi:hypothetical protein